MCVLLAIQANSGNLNNFIHVPTHEFLEGRVRKAVEQHEDASNDKDEVEQDAQEAALPPPQLAVELDPQLIQAGEHRFLSTALRCKGIATEIIIFVFPCSQPLSCPTRRPQALACPPEPAPARVEELLPGDGRVQKPRRIDGG